MGQIKKADITKLWEDFDNDIFLPYRDKFIGQANDFYQISKEKGLSDKDALLDTIACISYTTMKYVLFTQTLKDVGFNPDLITREDAKRLLNLVK